MIEETRDTKEVSTHTLTHEDGVTARLALGLLHWAQRRHPHHNGEVWFELQDSLQRLQRQGQDVTITLRIRDDA